MKLIGNQQLGCTWALGSQLLPLRMQSVEEAGCLVCFVGLFSKALHWAFYMRGPWESVHMHGCCNFFLPAAEPTLLDDHPGW
jgi:hypothetical protein